MKWGFSVHLFDSPPNHCFSLMGFEPKFLAFKEIEAEVNKHQNSRQFISRTRWKMSLKSDFYRAFWKLVFVSLSVNKAEPISDQLWSLCRKTVENYAIVSDYFRPKFNMVLQLKQRKWSCIDFLLLWVSSVIRENSWKSADNNCKVFVKFALVKIFWVGFIRCFCC